MAIKVVISRRVPVDLVPNLKPMLLKLRSLAGAQPGYITGETLVNIEDREDVLVLSTWNSPEEWKAWLANPQRREIENTIDSLLGAPVSYRMYYYG